MRDFTLPTYKLLLTTLKDQQYTFQTFAEFLKNPQPRAIILRHDVDARKLNSLRTARIENEMGIAGTYNFRMVPQSYDEAVIREIAGMGHEIGYHYEELAITKGNIDKAIKLFEKNLEILRQITQIETICMHGSPLSRYDNRKLWEKYNYRNYGIIGEPYFDLDFSKILYLTDTGRRWDGEKVSVRDKVPNQKEHWRRKTLNTNELIVEYMENSNEKELKEIRTHKNKITSNSHYRSTFDIINARPFLFSKDQIMICVHPQRWNSKLNWLFELLFQNFKNLIKRVIIKNNQY